MDEIIKVLTGYWPAAGPLLALVLTYAKRKDVIDFIKKSYIWSLASLSAPAKLEGQLGTLALAIQAIQTESNAWRVTLTEKLGKIEKELTFNSGSSLKDIVTQTQNLALLGELRYQQVFANSLNGLYECNIKGERTWSNEKLCQIFGMSEYDMRGNGWLKAVFDSTRLNVEAAWNHTVKNGTPYTFSYDIVNQKTGQKVAVHDNVVILKDNEGKVLKYLGTISYVMAVNTIEAPKI